MTPKDKERRADALYYDTSIKRYHLCQMVANREGDLDAILSPTTIAYSLDEGAFEPIRAHQTDAGADLRTPFGFTLPPHGSMDVDTGVHVELPHGTCARVEPKSGLNVNGGIVAWGLIDEGYSGSIVVKLYNLGKLCHYFDRGDKIAQLTVSPVLYPAFERVGEVRGGERGSSGFGSTGR